MVVEREPPKLVAQSPRRPSQPEFGKPSPLQNRLQSSADNLFIIPKPNQARPDHKIFAPAESSHLLPASQLDHISLFQPTAGGFTTVNSHSRSGYHVDLTKPVPPVFSSFKAAAGGFTAANPENNHGYHVDLTRPEDPYYLNARFLDNRFGAVDPYSYIDAGKATENIKALLEGVFEDDEDKPITRSRKKKAALGIAEKLGKLDVDAKRKNDNLNDHGGDKEEEEEVEEAEDDDADDGTIEGLNVKLLPHQVEGVEWMKDKEIGLKKKNGILPKGGILADDVSGLHMTTECVQWLIVSVDGFR